METFTLQDIISFLGTDAYSVGSQQITYGRLFVAALAFIVFLVISWITKRAIARALTKKGVKNEQTIQTTCMFVHYAFIILGAVTTLKIGGLDLSTIFAAGAVLTVGLGFAMQNIAQNFVSGVILFVERSIEAGDILHVDGRVVKVLKIGIRSTLALTRNNEEMIIPNSNIVQGTVVNYTMSDSSYLLGTLVGVSYSSDMKLVKETLLQVGETLPWRIPDSTVSVLMREFADSSVVFSLMVQVSNPWKSRRFTAEMNEAIWWAFKEQNITIAFPQVDVHVIDGPKI